MNRPFEPLNMTTKKWMEIIPQVISIDILVETQEGVCDWELPEGHSFCGDPFIHVVLYQGIYYISDGHNRVSEAKKKGHKEILVRLLIKE